MWNKILHHDSIPRVKHFLWRLCHDSLPAGMIDPGPCSFCDEIYESYSHLFLSCPWKQQVWSFAGIGNLPASSQINSPLKILEWVFSGLPDDMELFCICLWAIWHERNKRRFGTKSSSPLDLFQLASRYAMKWKAPPNLCS